MEISTALLATLVESATRADGDGSQEPGLAVDGNTHDRQAWYTVLIDQTLRYAEETVLFYRERVRRGGLSAAAFNRLSDLARFPVITKADVAADPASFLSETAPCETIHCTSGTTARRLHIYGNRDEERAQSLLSRLRRPAASCDELVLRVVPGPRRLYSPTHPGLGSTALVVGYTTNQDNHQWYDYTDYLAEVLNGTYRFSGRPSVISVVHITPPWMLEFITRKFVDRGVDPSAFGIRRVGVSGGFSTSRHRSFVSGCWKADYTSSYSCSEVASGEALECGRTPGVYRPGPSLYAEVVDPETFEPVAPGEHGLVLVTSLYPFQQVMPFVRYNTEDIAQRVASGTDEGSQAVAFRPIGRLHDCLRLGLRHFFGTREVLEAVSPFNEIPQVLCPRYELRLEHGERPTIGLRVETVEVSDAKRAWLRSEIRKRLHVQYRLAAASAGPDPVFECELVHKGELRDYRRLVPDR